MVVLAACISAAATGAAAGGGLSVRAALSMRAALTPCSPPVPKTVVCYSRAGAGAVSGLGAVSQSYVLVVESAPAGCPAGSFTLLPTTVRLRVAGRGGLVLELAGTTTCADSLGVLNVERPFTILLGSGEYGGAAGGGLVRHAATLGSSKITGRDTYSGSIVVPGLDFDTLKPRLRGARSKTVRSPRGSKSMRVPLHVSAWDAHDGSISTTCRPRSGSRFRLGTTRVRCSATDSSANTARASFTVTVKATP
jgi:hypothetical protein